MNIIDDCVWIVKYAPKSIEEVILDEDNKKRFLSWKVLPQNVLLTGDTGIGKSTLARLFCQKFAPNSSLHINASDETGIDMVREKIIDFISTVSMDGNQKIVSLQEADFLSDSAQGALREIMEESIQDVKFILTGNYAYKINQGLKSRCQAYDLKPSIRQIGEHVKHIIRAEKIKVDADQAPNLGNLIRKHYPDIRKTINELHKFCYSGSFVYTENHDNSVGNEVKRLLSAKENVFDIRKYVIDHEVDFANNYHNLMRNLFDLYVADRNSKALIYIADHMYKDSLVMDKEVNFSALLFNLSNLA